MTIEHVRLFSPGEIEDAPRTQPPSPEPPADPWWKIVGRMLLIIPLLIWFVIRAILALLLIAATVLWILGAIIAVVCGPAPFSSPLTPFLFWTAPVLYLGWRAVGRANCD